MDLPGYAQSGLPVEAMGRPLTEESLFFAAGLAAGGALGELAHTHRSEARREGEGLALSGG